MNLIGINLCWLSNQDSVKKTYEQSFKQLQNSGINVIRVWCPPWTIPHYLSTYKNVENYYDYISGYLSEIVNLAESHRIKVVVCLYAHVSLVYRDWYREVENKQDSWFGHPLCFKNGGPCNEPSEFFTNYDAIALQKNFVSQIVRTLRSSRALLAWEIFNEADNIDNFDEHQFYLWVEAMIAVIKSQDHKTPITISFADPFIGKKFWEHPYIDIVQVHLHGWPTSDPATNIALLKERYGYLNKPFFCGEFSWDSQSIPSKNQLVQIPEVVCASLAMGCLWSSMPWWWDTVLNASDVTYRLARINLFLKDEWNPKKLQTVQVESTLVSPPQDLRIDYILYLKRRITERIGLLGNFRAVKRGAFITWFLYLKRQLLNDFKVGFASSSDRNILVYLNARKDSGQSRYWLKLQPNTDYIVHCLDIATCTKHVSTIRTENLGFLYLPTFTRNAYLYLITSSVEPDL